MRIRVFLIAGIIGIAVVAGVLEALTTPRKREETEGKKEEGGRRSSDIIGRGDPA